MNYIYINIYGETMSFFSRGGWKNWSPNWLCGKGIRDSVVGIVGCGQIGTSIAEKLSKFKIAQLLYYSRSEKPAGRFIS